MSAGTAKKAGEGKCRHLAGRQQWPGEHAAGAEHVTTDCGPCAGTGSG